MAGPTDLVAAPDEHAAPVADGYVAAALGGAGELRGLAALVGRPWQVFRPRIVVAISHLEAALCSLTVPTAASGEQTKETGGRSEPRRKGRR